MGDTIRVGVIGCGRVAQHYINILDSGAVTGFNIVGSFDLNSDRSRIFSDHFNAICFSSYEELLERGRPDLILILTPSGLHYEHSKIALKKGCHVLVEKPMTMLPCQSKELEEFAVSKNLMYGVVFQNRFNPAIMALEKQSIQNDLEK